MYVIHVTENLSDEWGGPAKSVPALANICKKNNVNYSLLSTFDCEEYENEIVKKYNLNLNLYKTSGFKKLKFSFGLFKRVQELIKLNECVVLHVHNLWNFPALMCFILSKYYKLPLVISPRGALEIWSLSQNKRLKKIMAFLFQKNAFKHAYAHVTSPEEKESVLRFCPEINEQNIFVIPNGVELPSLNFLDKFPNLTFLFMSRLHHKKGIMELLNAWERLSETKVFQKLQPKLLIAGAGETFYKNEIELYINQNVSLFSSVSLLGMVRGLKKQELLEKSHVFILPTYSENFGIAIAEAAANELPVITTTGAPWQLIDDYSCGWWIDLTVDNLFYCLDEVLHLEKESLVDKGVKAKRMIEENYTWTSLSNDYMNMYEAVVI